jgi:hypothetical protein
MVTDATSLFQTVANASARTGTPGDFFPVLESAMNAALGHKLFTVLLYHADAGETERFHTSDPGSYPVGGRKSPKPSVWTNRLFVEGEPYIGHDAGDIRTVFADHELILSLGCESVLNLPVVFAGRTLGTVNLLHEAGWYGERDVPVGQVFAALAVPALQALVKNSNR